MSERLLFQRFAGLVVWLGASQRTRCSRLYPALPTDPAALPSHTAWFSFPLSLPLLLPPSPARASTLHCSFRCSVAGNITSLLNLGSTDLTMGDVSVAGCQQAVAGTNYKVRGWGHAWGLQMLTQERAPHRGTAPSLLVVWPALASLAPRAI